MLTDIIPARYRRAVYALFSVAVVIVGALNAGGIDTGKATDVLTYLGGALGIMAAANTAPPRTRNDDGAIDPGSAALGLVAGLLVAYLILR